MVVRRKHGDHEGQPHHDLDVVANHQNVLHHLESFVLNSVLVGAVFVAQVEAAVAGEEEDPEREAEREKGLAAEADEDADAGNVAHRLADEAAGAGGGRVVCHGAGRRESNPPQGVSLKESPCEAEARSFATLQWPRPRGRSFLSSCETNALTKPTDAEKCKQRRRDRGKEEEA